MLTDPFGTAVLIGLAAAPLGALFIRRGRRAAVLGGTLAASGAAIAERLGAPSTAVALGLCVVVGAAAVLPGLPFGLFRRRSFGSAYPRGAFAGAVATAPLPASLAARRPSRLLDAADRLRLESALAELERKHGVTIAVALVARAGEVEGAHARAALYGGALALAGAAAAGASALLGLGAAAAGLVAGRALARTSFVRRIFVSNAALAAVHAQAASDAFAHAELAAAPRDRGLLVFASLFEARVSALAAPGLAGATGSEAALSDVAGAAARGFAAGGALAAFLAAAKSAEGLAAREAPSGSSAARPHPIRVED